MKKIVYSMFIFLICLKVNALAAESYIVMDYESGRVLEGSQIDKEKLIASTTKIMTAILVIENTNIEKEIEVPVEVLKAYGSNIYIEMGEKLTIKDLLYGLLLRSGNDAAITLAIATSNSLENFTILMNQKALDLGMKDTQFLNPHGLEEQDGAGNTSTAYDMALLMRYALQNDTFKEISGTKRYVTTSSYKTYEWHNKNKLLTNYEYTISGKTGFTKKARRTLVSAATKEDKTLIIVTLNDPEDFKDHESLYEKNFSQYSKATLLEKGIQKVEMNHSYGDLYLEEDFSILLTEEEQEKVVIEYQIEEIQNYKNKDKVGEVIVKLEDIEIARKSLYAKKYEEIEESLWKHILDILLFWR